METALALPAQTTKAQTASPSPTKQPAKPGPTELQIKVAAVQRASGNQAVQRAVESEVSEGAETVEKAPETPQEDKKHQAVAKEMTTKAKVQRTPISTPEEKQRDTVLAANAESKEVIETTNARLDHIDKLGEVKPKDLTAKEFMDEFEAAIKKLEETVPTKDSTAQTVKFVTGQRQAKQDFAAQDKKNTEPLRQELNREPVTCPEDKKVVPATYELTQDPAGDTPSVKQAKGAAPKPSADATVSLDEQSRELDEALVNHDVRGQRIDIKEESLAFPVSGEKSFDEAAAEKRQAQAEIAKARPQYRQEEKGVIHRAQNDIQSLVNIRGLMGHHKLRSEGFKKVLGSQKDHKAGIRTVKQQFFEKVEGIYSETKSEVDAELKSLQEIESIEETFDDILKDANDWFTGHVKPNLEYIYPDIVKLEYSDFAEDNAQRILNEYNRLAGEKYRRLDELIGRLTEKSKTLGEMAKGARRLAEGDINLYFQALSNVKEKAAQELFEFSRSHFIFLVKSNVELKIAKRVAIAINRARRAIEKGKDRVKRAYDRLSPTEKFEVEDVYNAVNDRFADLHTLVDERQHEIINEMARTYTKGVGKLKSTFDQIKKDVEAGVLGRAWNKIKAVVNAIIDFATKIAELLGRMLHLLPDIISSPGDFFSNLGSGIKAGFHTFIDGIGEYLATAFFDWIRGSSGVKVQLPKEFDAAGIFSLFTQLLNLTTETVWLRMEVVYDKTVADAFRKGEFVVGKALEIFDIIKREGLGGLWDHIVESLGTMLSDALDEIREQVLYAAIQKVLLEIGKLLVPGGGFIAIAEKIIRLLLFIFEARDKILKLIDAFVSSMENAVKGDIGGIVNLVTTALTSFITFALDFLVAFFGLSSLKEKVERMIARMQTPIIRGIDFVLKKFKPLVMKGAELVAKGTEKVIRAGLPQDPLERLKLGMQTAVRAVDALSGRAITQKIITPVLAGVRIRYGFTTLVPVVKNGIWWVEGTINPTLTMPTHQQASTQSASQQELESLVSKIAPSYPVDSLGRPKGPSGHVLGIKSGDRDAMTSKFMCGYQPRDQRGHLIGDRFHGPAQPSNLVPMHPTLNLSTYKSYENTIATKGLTLINNNRPVLVFMTAIPKYPVDDPMDDASFRPSSVTISARISTLRLGVSPATLEEENVNSPPLANPPAEVTSVAINGDIEELKAALRVLSAPRLQNSRNVRRLVDAVVTARREGRFSSLEGFSSRMTVVLGHDYVHLLEAIRTSEIEL
jgi:hypothetical protein